MEMTKLTPLGHEEIAVLVNGSAVGRVADALLPLLGRQAVVGPLPRVRIVADLRDDFASLVQDRDPALQFGNNRIVPTDVNGGGHA